MKITDGVGLDSQCLSYLIDAINGIVAPSGDLAPEQCALFRTYMYSEGTLYVTPTVKAECEMISDSDRNWQHRSYMLSLFGLWPVENPSTAESRARELQKLHPKLNDCLIFAEAEQVGMKTLLSYDDNFLKRLGGQSVTLRIMRPSEYWSELGVPRGASPRKVPDPSNPLSKQDWWLWA